MIDKAIYRVVLVMVLCLFNENCFSWGLLNPSNYDECISDVVKNAKTDLSAEIGIQNCSERFKKNEAINDCSAIWNGIKFVSGYPVNKGFYQEISILNTTHRIFLPKDMSKEMMEKVVNENIEKVKLICPFLK
jgi:hypothetical protein